MTLDPWPPTDPIAPDARLATSMAGPLPPDGLRRRWSALAMLLGLGIGLFSWLSDWLLGPLIGTPLLVLVNLGNAAAPWMAAAFAAGAVQPRPVIGAVLGVAALVVAVLVYYLVGWAAAALEVAGAAFSPLTGVALLWLAMAAIAGTVFGMAGSAWRTAATPLAAIGVSVLGAGLLAEATHVFLQLGGPAAIDLSVGRMQLVLIELGVAALLPALMLAGRQRPMAYIAAPALAVAGLLAMAAVQALLMALLSG